MCHEVALEFFATSAPDPPLWTLNRRFAMFRTIWVHLGSFGCLTELGSKRAELVQKFVPRSRVGIFHNKGTRSSPLYSKMMFWCISNYLGAFGTVWLYYENRSKKGRISAKVRATKSRRNFSQRTYRVHPIRPKHMFWCVSYYFGTFGIVWFPYETRCKTGRTSAKVCAT